MHRDLLVIGGGINGVGTAADAAGRGLSVVLCEMGDLASGTSSASSKMIHGGLRYLEHREFGMVRQSLRERNYLLHNAAHLITPQRFVIPVDPAMRPYWQLRAGLWLYDCLATGSGLPSSAALSLEEFGLQPEFSRGLSYYDCTVDDARLVLHVALQARQHGAEILPRTKFIKATRQAKNWIVTLQQDQKTLEYTVDAIVNTAGPYVQNVDNNILHINTEHKMRLIKGCHIIVPKLFAHDDALVLQNTDTRIIFIIPYCGKFSLIGTTEVRVDSPDDLSISEVEIEYLCENVNRALNNKTISRADIIHKFSGIRPLYDDHHAEPKDNSRDFVLDVDINKAPLISLFGGKLTTYRHTAEQICNQLQKLMPRCGEAWTEDAFLPGAHFPNDDFQLFAKHIYKIYANLPQPLLDHYLQNYGTRLTNLLQNVHNVGNLGEHFGGLLYRREVDFLHQEEWAKTAEDILWRRGKQGLFFTPDQVKSLDDYLKRFA